MTRAYNILLAGWVLMAPAVASANVTVEYIGHACFVVESPDGVRVVIDPFNSNRWLGYRFPEDVEADAVLITHPHYDHDASYYWGDDVPVFREPGEYTVGDVALKGIGGKHAAPYGKDFGQKNIIWLVESGGVRIAHLGDNGPLTEANVQALRRVDVLMAPVDGQDHILKAEELVAIREALDDPLTIPMHYRLQGFLGLPQSLGPIEPWLARQSGVVRLESNRAKLGSRPEPETNVLVFQPSPGLEVWSEELARGWEMLDEARSIFANHPNRLSEAAALVSKAAASVDCIVFSFQQARALAESGRPEQAIDVLERALARAVRDDWEYRMRSRSLLARLYEQAGHTERAASQYRAVLAGSYRLELLEAAEAFFTRMRSP